MYIIGTFLSLPFSLFVHYKRTFDTYPSFSPHPFYPTAIKVINSQRTVRWTPINDWGCCRDMAGSCCNGTIVFC